MYNKEKAVVRRSDEEIRIDIIQSYRTSIQTLLRYVNRADEKQIKLSVVSLKRACRLVGLTEKEIKDIVKEEFSKFKKKNGLCFIRNFLQRRR